MQTLKKFGRLPYHSYVDQLQAIKDLQDEVSKLRERDYQNNLQNKKLMQLLGKALNEKKQ